MYLKCTPISIFTNIVSGGGLLVLEKILNDDKVGPTKATKLDMEMLVLAEGRERTLAEYTELLQKHGFSNIQAKTFDDKTQRDAILAYKV